MADSPVPDEKLGAKGATVATAAALALIIAALFVFPGFVAAWFSRECFCTFVEDYSGDEWSIGGPIEVTIDGVPTRSHTVMRVETLFAEAVLYPAYQVMKRSVMAREFYEWQFRAAGGLSMGIMA